MTGFADWRATGSPGGEGKPVTLDDHGRGARFRTGESAMNLTWRFSDAELASLALPAE